MRVAIIGGGSASHLLAVLLSRHGHRVRILTSRPFVWQRELLLRDKSETLTGHIDLCSDSPDEVLSDAQIAFLCMPVHQYRNAVRTIMPSLARNADCIVGTMYGQGGFDWIVRAEAMRMGCAVPHYFSIGLLPWITRTESYGRSVIYYGSNVCNAIATSHLSDYAYLQDYILDDLGYKQWGCGKFEYVPNFITLTLTVDNQIIHPSRCYTLMTSRHAWKDKRDVPLFYRDWDEPSSHRLSGVDEDYSRVRAKLFELRPSLRNNYDLSWLNLQKWAYREDVKDVQSFFVNAASLRCINTPVVQNADGMYELEVDHRFFKDDFACGLEICEWFAAAVNCDVPHVAELMRWYREEIQPKQRVSITSGTPSAFNMTIEDVLK